MRACLIGLGLVLGLSIFAPAAHAQDGGFSDPFFLYYGYFLPRQNALASQAQPEDFYRNQSLQRQYSAQVDQRGLFGDAGYLGQDELNPLNAFGRSTASSRMVRTSPRGPRTTVSLRGHSAPADYFQRSGNYYPTMRTGLGRGPGRGGMGGSMVGGGASGGPGSLGGGMRATVPTGAPSIPGGGRR